jgi:hypothetical protein
MSDLEQPTGFRPFARVRLKSGGRTMLVASRPGEDPVQCVYKSEDGQMQREPFPAADLEPGDPNAVVFPPSEDETRRKRAFEKLAAKYPDLIPSGFRFECDRGWIGILERYFDDVGAILPKGAKFSLERAFEKYGELDIEISCGGVSSEVSVALSKAEKRAWFRALLCCETCGEPGRMRDSTHLRVSCEEHSEGCTPLPLSDEIGLGECSVGDGYRYGYDEKSDELVLLGSCEDFLELEE